MNKVNNYEVGNTYEKTEFATKNFSGNNEHSNTN